MECPAMEPLFEAMKSSQPGGETHITEEIDISRFIPSKFHYLTFLYVFRLIFLSLLNNKILVSSTQNIFFSTFCNKFLYFAF